MMKKDINCKLSLLGSLLGIIRSKSALNNRQERKQEQTWIEIISNYRQMIPKIAAEGTIRDAVPNLHRTVSHRSIACR